MWPKQSINLGEGTVLWSKQVWQHTHTHGNSSISYCLEENVPWQTITMYNHWYNPILNTYLYTSDIIVGPYKGYMKETNIERCPYMFFPYIVFLFQTIIESIINKAPFQIIPQYTLTTYESTILDNWQRTVDRNSTTSCKVRWWLYSCTVQDWWYPNSEGPRTKKRKREEVYIRE